MDITLRAYAKINLGLRVLKKRSDGYHDIETIFHRIDCHDDIRLAASSSLSMTCNDPALPVDEENLCVKAADTLRKWCGIDMGAHISLTKRIPVGAGLGGGSSDAAATLLGLNRMWGVSLPLRDLTTIALSLGSDLPYFLQPGSAFARGRGEILDYFPLDLPYWIITVFPGIPISTEWAYRNVKPRDRESALNLKDALLRNLGNACTLTEYLVNDFESVIIGSHDIVGTILREFMEEGAEFTRMSGSGSSVFAFFPQENPARRAAERIGRDLKTIVTAPHFQPPEE